MLTRLRFRNFKAWQDSGDIRLAPLTVLFGANSAGKTSIPQLLLLLKQTAESPDRQRALQLGDSRSLVDLGTYDDVVHNHDTSQSLEVELGWTLSEPLVVTDPLADKTVQGSDLVFHVSLTGDARRQPTVQSLQYSLTENGRPIVTAGMERGSGDGMFDVTAKGYDLVKHTGRNRPVPPPERFYGFPDAVTAAYQNSAFLSDLVFELERLFKSVFYVGPLREYPKRLYLWSGETPDHVGVKGDRAVEAILAAGDRQFSVTPGQQGKALAQVVAQRLQEMKLISDFQVAPLGPHRSEYEVLVRTSPTRPQVKISDVGFGISQVLPVIVEALYVPRRSIVIFEQPEIHLHPRVQADLADLFVDAVRAQENGAPRDCQFIVESHSEHFLRRLQRRIAEERISTTDTALYFVHTHEQTPRLEALDVDPYGNILNWPEGFFGDEMDDLLARSDAQARRLGRSTPR